MVIGTAAGLFSGLFGVGGGTVIVPLLVVWLGYGEREATGTSLAAIVFIAAFAAAVQYAYGNVHVLDGLLVGIPAVGGVLLGTFFVQIVFVEVPSFLPEFGYPGLIDKLEWIVIGFMWLTVLILRPRGMIPERRYRVKLAKVRADAGPGGP